MENNKDRSHTPLSQAEDSKVNAREARESRKKTTRNNVGTSQQGSEREQDLPISGKH